MEGITHTLAKRLFYFLVLCFVLLIVQDRFDLFKGGELKGAYTPAEKPVFSEKHWFDESYQRGQDAYLRDHFPFRGDAVRLHNQLDFSLFRKSNVSTSIVGKDEYIIGDRYIDSYLGLAFEGKRSIFDKVARLQKFQQLLSSRGKHFVLLLAPSKAYYYPDKIPEDYGEQQDSTNYTWLKEALQAYPINVIDYNGWFMDMKDTVSYPLMPKSGTHWTSYGVGYAVDSLIGYLEGSMGQDLPEFGWDRLHVTREANADDRDIESNLNLIRTYSDVELAYPHFTVDNEGKYRPKALIVGDSFYWGMLGASFNQVVDSKSGYWYYNSTIYSDGKEVGKSKNADLKAELDRSELVIIIGTEPALGAMAWGFLGKAFKALED